MRYDMKCFGVSPIVVLALPATLQAGTFENTDLDAYRYETVIDGVQSFSTINGESSLYGFCDNGCVLRLIGTGQTMEIQPGDDIVIENGALKRTIDE
jgi:hypothetical protein